jgi:hypothetical protein
MGGVRGSSFIKEELGEGIAAILGKTLSDTDPLPLLGGIP